MPARKRRYLIDQFALWMAIGGKMTDWCKKHEMSLRTARRWYSEERVRRQIEGHRGRAVDRAIGKMARSLGKAVERIVKLIEEGQTDAVKLAAAKALIEKLIDVQNHAELKAELDRLDRRLELQEQRRARNSSKRREPDRAS